MNLFHILCEFCRTHDQNPLSYLKLFLSGKHSDFQQMLPTPTAKFQQSQCHKLNLVFFQATFLYCESYLFWQGALLLHTATLCWPLPPLPTFSYCVHSLYQLILVARAWRASQHLYELMLLGPVSHFGTSICRSVLQLLFVLQS